MSELPSKPFHCISIVLPVYKTAIYLKELHKRLRDTLDNLKLDFELLMIDDGSPDNSWSIIEQLAAEDSRVKGIRLSRNFGQHPAIAAGFELAKGDAVVLMDTDLQDRPEELPLLLEKLTDDIEVVYTVKKGEQPAWFTRMTSQLHHYVFSRLTQSRIPNNAGTYRVCTRRFLDAMLKFREFNVLYGPLMYSMGFKHVLVEVQHDKRQGSKSSYTFAKRLKLGLNSLVSYTDIPHQLFMYFGSSILFLSFVYILIVLLEYWIWDIKLPAGMTMIVLLLAGMLGILTLSLGIIGIYIFRIYQEVLARPRYLIAQQLNLSSNTKGV